MHDESVVARVGANKLYRSQLESVIPSGTPPEDSAAMAARYINLWAADLVFLEAAQRELPKADKDVSAQLEDYRRTLLKYRYEQSYVNERLDTAVSASQIKEYYDAHSTSYRLSSTAVKARLMSISPDSPDLERLRKMMSSTDEDQLRQLDTLAATVAAKYTDFGGGWVDVTTLSRRLDSQTPLELPSGQGFVKNSSESGLSVAYVYSIIPAGSIPPVEYCQDKIRESIISIRKNKLVSDLERDLLEHARQSGNYEVY